MCGRSQPNAAAAQSAAPASTQGSSSTTTISEDDEEKNPPPEEKSEGEASIPIPREGGEGSEAKLPETTAAAAAVGGGSGPRAESEMKPAATRAACAAELASERPDAGLGVNGAETTAPGFGCDRGADAAAAVADAAATAIAIGGGGGDA